MGKKRQTRSADNRQTSLLPHAQTRRPFLSELHDPKSLWEQRFAGTESFQCGVKHKTSQPLRSATLSQSKRSHAPQKFGMRSNGFRKRKTHSETAFVDFSKYKKNDHDVLLFTLLYIQRRQTRSLALGGEIRSDENKNATLNRQYYCF